MTTYNQQIGQRIEHARGLLGLSQARIAAECHMHRQTIQKIEAGGRTVKAQEVTPLAAALGVTVSWLLTGDTSVEARAESKLRTAITSALDTLRSAQLSDRFPG